MAFHALNAGRIHPARQGRIAGNSVSAQNFFLPAGFLPVANLLTRCGGRFGSARALRYPLFYSDLASVEIRRGFCKRQEPLSKKNKNKIQSVTNSCLPRPVMAILAIHRGLG